VHVVDGELSVEEEDHVNSVYRFNFIRSEPTVTFIVPCHCDNHPLHSSDVVYFRNLFQHSYQSLGMIALSIQNCFLNHHEPAEIHKINNVLSYV